MRARGLDLETDTSNIRFFYGSPSEVSLEPGYEATSEVYVIDDLTFFKGLSGDEASSIIINSWLFTTLATTPIKFIKSTGLIHN